MREDCPELGVRPGERRCRNGDIGSSESMQEGGREGILKEMMEGEGEGESTETFIQGGEYQ